MTPAEFQHKIGKLAYARESISSLRQEIRRIKGEANEIAKSLLGEVPTEEWIQCGEFIVYFEHCEYWQDGNYPKSIKIERPLSLDVSLSQATQNTDSQPHQSSFEDC